MKLKLNEDDGWDRVYILPPDQQEQLTHTFRDTIEQQYRQLDVAWKLAAKTAARTILTFLEKKIAEKAGQEKAASLCRPARGIDPVLHLLTLGEHLFQEMMSHVQVELTTEEGAITAVSLTKDTGEGGGPVDSHGDIRERQDDGSQILGSTIHVPIPNMPSLHPGQ